MTGDVPKMDSLTLADGRVLTDPGEIDRELRRVGGEWVTDPGEIIRTLRANGWDVKADGRLLPPPGAN